MNVEQLLVLSLLGLLGGVLSGVAGVGGGIIFVPALVYVAGWDIKEAVAASLVIIVFSALSGTLRNLRSENAVNWKVTALLSSTVAPSALIGVAISRASSNTVVELVFATMLLALAYPTARGASRYAESRGKLPPALVLLAGVGIGTLAGLVGVGGGVLMVPLMVLGLGLRPKIAIATSLSVVFFTGLVGAAGYIATGFTQLLSLPPLIAGSIAGAWLGVRLRDRTPDVLLQGGFALFMVAVALQLFIDAAKSL